MNTYLPTGMAPKHFEKTITGNVLSEILREVQRALEAANAGDSTGAAIYLEYIESIVEDACYQHGSDKVLGSMEISRLKSH